MPLQPRISIVNIYHLIFIYLQLAVEKEDCEREKWEILKKAKEATERAYSLKTELDQKDESFRKMSAELTEVYKTN